MTYEKLKEKLDSGEVVVFKNEDNNYIAIGGAGKDSGDDYRDSGMCYTLREAKSHIGDDDGHDEEKLKEELPDWKYIESYPHAHGKPVKTGTKVLILNGIKEDSIDWNKPFKNKIDNFFEVREQHGSDYNIYNKDKTNYWLLKRTAFIIAPDEEEEEDIVVIDGKNFSKDTIKEALKSYINN